jgi:hypothetical protein
MSDIPCPCCGFLTLEHEYGSFTICTMCDWEDDGVQLANPTSAGGANNKSLAEAQACTLAKYPVGLKLVKGHRRSFKWRPLNSTELRAENLRSSNERWDAPAVRFESEAYWSNTQEPSAS